MQSRPKVWISTIVVIFIAAFLLGFAPIRRARTGGFAVDSLFAFRLSTPLVQSDNEIPDKEQEIRELLKDKQLELDHVKLRGRDLLEVETIALDQQHADTDHDTVVEVLKEKYGPLSDTRLPGQAREAQPLLQWGPFAIHRPVPQLKLGLDLQGGAHVVLRCLSTAEMSFVSPEDKPLVKSQPTQEQEQTQETSGYQPPHTADTLQAAVRNLLQRMGASPSQVSVSVVAANRLVVETRPANKTQAKKQYDAINNYMHENYPTVAVEALPMNVVLVEPDTADKVKYIIEQRLYSLGEIREPVIQKQGADRIIVEMPGVKDPQRVLDILKNTAMLEFRLVPANYKPASPELSTYEEWTDEKTGQMVSWEQVRAESSPEFSGRDLMANASVRSGQTGDWVVAFELKPNKKAEFHDFTRRNVGRIMAIVLDRECQMAPVIRSAIPGSGVIEGNMTAQEAGDLKLLLNAGALPVPLEIVENRTVSATLGKDSVLKSLHAASLGVAAVMIFMIAYYRLPGLLANIALLLYMVLVIAVTAYSGTTLTLPGIAGIILSLGTAVDANVIIFERLKEELWANKSMRAAVAAGFDRAWTAILDANVTTLITAAVLYWLGTSLIKGFAVMLFIGIICHLFTAITVTRWLLTVVGETRLGQNRRLYGVAEPGQEQAEQPQPS